MATLLVNCFYLTANSLLPYMHMISFLWQGSAQYFCLDMSKQLDLSYHLLTIQPPPPTHTHTQHPPLLPTVPTQRPLQIPFFLEWVKASLNHILFLSLKSHDKRTGNTKNFENGREWGEIQPV